MAERHPGVIGRFGLFLCTLLMLAVPAAARNLALVIGNDAYRSIPALAKPVGDARAMRAALASLGFAVSESENATDQEMTGALAKFAGEIVPGDVVFFHFSGYGIAIGGENFLLPIDVPGPKSGRQDGVPRLSFSADQIISSFKAKGARVVVGVLDACRDNPFAAAGAKGVGASRGLAPMSPPPGAFILYSAGAGETSLDRLSGDDAEQPSVFARGLLQALAAPSLSLVEIAKETQQRVHDIAAGGGHDQVPAYYDAVVGNFVLGDAAAASVAKPATTEREADAPSIGPLAAPAKGHTVIASVVPGSLDGATVPIRSAHGDWQVRCDTPSGAQRENCVLMQFVTATNIADVGLTVILLQTMDGKAKLMRILAPLGVLLPSGLGLAIDGNDFGRAGFVRCLPNGCVAEVLLDNALLGKLEGGKTALFTLYQTTEGAIGMPISLNGLAAGLAELVGQHGR